MKTILAVVVIVALTGCGKNSEPQSNNSAAPSQTSSGKTPKEAATPHFKAYVPDATVRKNPKF